MAPELIYLLGSLAYMGLEAWLGKTNKVKPGSVLEAAYHGVKLLAKVLRKK
jgi:hypothetical protein